MEIAKLVLEYIRVLIWPLAATIVLLRYGRYLIYMLEKSKVKLSLYGVAVQVNLVDLERMLTSAVGGKLTPKQWNLLKRIAREGSISVEKEGYEMHMNGDLG